MQGLLDNCKDNFLTIIDQNIKELKDKNTELTSKVEELQEDYLTKITSEDHENLIK